MNIDPMAGHDQESDKILKAEIALTDHAYMRIKQRMGLSGILLCKIENNQDRRELCSAHNRDIYPQQPEK